MHENRALVERILAGDQYAFERLIKKYQKLVSHIVFRMVKNETDREDICQDVFIRVYRNLEKFRFESKLSTWIGRIAYNGCINYLEKKKVPLYDDITDEERKFEENIADQPGPDELAAESDISEKLKNMIAELPLKYRTIVTLYHLDELSYEEIGSVMNMPEGTVKSYLFRARKLLKEKLEKRYKGEDLWK